MCYSITVTLAMLYTTWTAACSCVTSFMSLHMRYLGIPNRESVIISAIMPLLQLVTCCSASRLATTSSSFKKLTYWSLIFTIFAALLLTLAPRLQETRDNDSSVVLVGSKSRNGSQLVMHDCNGQCIEGVTTQLYFVSCQGTYGGQDQTGNLTRVCLQNGNGSCDNFEISDHGFFTQIGSAVLHEDDECTHPIERIIWQNQNYTDVICPDIHSNSTYDLKCSMKGEKGLRSNCETNDGFDLWTYAALRSAFEFCYGISTTFVEASARFILKAHRKDIRLYSIWSQVSAAITTPLAGIFLDMYSNNPTYNIYKPLFFSSAAMTAGTIAFVSPLSIDGASMTNFVDTLSHLPHLLRDFRIFIFLAAWLCLGVLNGFFDTFLFWYLEDLQSPYYAMGLSNSLALLVGLPLLSIRVRSIVKKLLPGDLLSLCFLCQCIRCAGYIFADSFWWSLLIELTGTLSFSLMWCALSGFIKLVQPRESAAALRNFASVVHYCFGKSLGICLGGTSMVLNGFRVTFNTMAIFSAFATMYCFTTYRHFLDEPDNRITHITVAYNRNNVENVPAQPAPV